MQPFQRGAGVFVGRITPSGERLFYFRYTDPLGRRPFLPIGPFHPKGDGGLTVAQAYDRAAELSALYRTGVKDLREHFAREATALREAADLATAERQRQIHAAAEAVGEAQRRLTVRGLFDQWQRAELAPQVLADGTRTGRKDRGEWVRQSYERRVFPKLADVAAQDVRRADLMAILDDCKAGGTLRTANVLFTDLRQMFRFAVEREIVPLNPLEGVRRSKIGGKATERERVLNDDEVRTLWQAVRPARMHPRSVAAIWLLLATGARVGELMGAVWAEKHTDLNVLAAEAEAAGVKVGTVDAAARIWYLPDSKNQRDHTIHLSDFALEQIKVLSLLREAAPDADGNTKPVPWLFPNTARTGPVCVKSFGKQLADRQRPPGERIQGRSKASQALVLDGGKWTAHDLRRTAATLMARLGFSTDVIDECLNHKLQSRVAKVYIRDRRQAEQVRAFDALGIKLQAIVAATCENGTNVRHLHAAA